MSRACTHPGQNWAQPTKPLRVWSTPLHPYIHQTEHRTCYVENNLRLQDELYTLRSETQAAFDEAKALERRWKELEKEQREVYQVCFFGLF